MGANAQCEFGPTDAKQEAEPYFADRLRGKLEQALSAYEHLTLSLDPELRGTGTYDYHDKRNGMAKLVSEFARRSETKEGDARRELARHLAVVQLFP